MPRFGRFGSLDPGERQPRPFEDRHELAIRASCLAGFRAETLPVHSSRGRISRGIGFSGGRGVGPSDKLLFPMSCLGFSGDRKSARIRS